VIRERVTGGWLAIEPVYGFVFTLYKEFHRPLKFVFPLSCNLYGLVLAKEVRLLL
jgi:hypothetical protein